MPLVGIYTWTEKKDSIKCSIPLKGISPSKVDIFVTSSTLKVNYSPYIVDIVLKHPIDQLKHKATVKDGTLNVTLYKLTSQLWGSLEYITDNKDELDELRKKSIIEHEELEKDLKEKRKDRKIDDEKYSLRKQMAIDSDERTRLDNLKEEEKNTAEREVYETFNQMQAREAKDKKDKELKNKTVNVSSSSSSSITTTIENPKTIFNVDDYLAEDDIDDDIDDDYENNDNNSSIKAVDNKKIIEENPIEDDDDEVRYIPPPRSAGISHNAENKVDIKFTPRLFPTPMRESKLPEEEDWILKNRKHLKKHGVLGKNLSRGDGVDITEEDPNWLKAKGDDFFRNGDLRSAVNAYSAAIDGDEHMLPSYSNRSACYLKLGKYLECQQDCATGIKLIESETDVSKIDSNLKALVLKLYMRRAVANCQLGLFAESLADFEISKNLITQSRYTGEGVVNGMTLESVDEDIKKINVLISVESLKKEGDITFAESKLDTALLKYSEALTLFPAHVGCLSNRSACKLALGDIEGCISDCTEALGILQVDIERIQSTKSEVLLEGSNNINMLSSILPPSGSEKRRQWAIKTITRRGVAYARLGNYKDAVTDYTVATGLDPTNELLKSDLEKYKNLQSTNT